MPEFITTISTVSTENEPVIKFLNKEIGEYGWHYGKHPLATGDVADYSLIDALDEEGEPSREIILQSENHAEEDAALIDENDYFTSNDFRENAKHLSEKYFFAFANKYLKFGLNSKQYLQANLNNDPQSFSDLGIKANIVPFVMFNMMIDVDDDTTFGSASPSFSYSLYPNKVSGIGVLDTSHRRNVFIKETPADMSNAEVKKKLSEFESSDVSSAISKYMEHVITHECLHKIVNVDYENRYFEEGFVEFCTRLAVPALTDVETSILEGMQATDLYLDNTTNIADLFIALASSRKFSTPDIFHYFARRDSDISDQIDSFIKSKTSSEIADQIINRKIKDNKTIANGAEDILGQSVTSIVSPKKLSDLSLPEKIKFIKEELLN